MVKARKPGLRDCKVSGGDFGCSATCIKLKGALKKNMNKGLKAFPCPAHHIVFGFADSFGTC